MAIVRLLRGTNNLNKIPAAVRNRVIHHTRRFARMIERWIQTEMNKPKHGRVYYINGKRHVASAPGEVPAVLTGKLYRALRPRYTNGGMRAVIAPNVKSKNGAPYPTYLEYGTRKMAPRPFLKRGFDRFRNQYRDKMREILSNIEV